MNSILLTFFTAFLISYLVIPRVIKIANAKCFHDVPNNRSAHKTSVPTMGGIGIMAGILFSILIWGNDIFQSNFNLVLAGLFVLFSIGLADDLVPVSPYKKLATQFIAVLFLITADVRLTSLHGFLGIYELPIVASIVLTILSILFIINSFNLLDGIDGLAGVIVSFIGLVYGIWFYLLDQYFFALLSFALVGGVFGFLRYNIWQAKIFMGDSGSMVIGYLIAFLTLQFLNTQSIILGNNQAFWDLPTIALSLLILPILDTSSVFLLRIFKGRSPFRADKNHIHHLLLRIGHSHFKATLLLLCLNICFFLLALNLKNLATTSAIFILLGVAIFLWICLKRMVFLKGKKSTIIRSLDTLKSKKASSRPLFFSYDSSEELQSGKA